MNGSDLSGKVYGARRSLYVDFSANPNGASGDLTVAVVGVYKVVVEDVTLGDLEGLISDLDLKAKAMRAKVDAQMAQAR